MIGDSSYRRRLVTGDHLAFQAFTAQTSDYFTAISPQRIGERNDGAFFAYAKAGGEPSL